MKCCQLAHAGLHLSRWRRHETGIARPGATDPVLAAPELPRQAIGTAAPGQQPAMDLAQQTRGQGKALAQPGQSVLQPSDVTGDLHHVIERHAGSLLQFKEEQVGERRLGAFDLGGEQGLAAHVGVEEQLRIREQGRDAIEAAAGQQRPIVQRLQRTLQQHRRIGRQWRWHERPDHFPSGAGDLVATGAIAPHEASLGRTLNTRQAYSRESRLL